MINKKQNNFRHCDAGSVMLETVFVFPLLFTLIMGIGQFAHILLAREMVAYAAFAAARAALPMSDTADNGAPSETQIAALQAAKQICAVITLGSEGSEGASIIQLPWLGPIAGSEALTQKLRVSTEHVPNVYERVTVSMDFPLVFPVAGNLIGGVSNLLDPAQPAGTTAPDKVVWSHRYNSGFFNPHLTITETAVAAKPFTVVTRNNLPAGYSSY